MPSRSAEEFITDDFLEVYTADGETADSYIERTVFTFKNTYANVYVCTSDYAEQSQVLGFGALRISARELKARLNGLKLTNSVITKGFTTEIVCNYSVMNWDIKLMVK